MACIFVIIRLVGVKEEFGVDGCADKFVGTLVLQPLERIYKCGMCKKEEPHLKDPLSIS